MLTNFNEPSIEISKRLYVIHNTHFPYFNGDLSLSLSYITHNEPTLTYHSPGVDNDVTNSFNLTILA